MLTEGTTAPTFTLPNQDGDPRSLEDYRGETVVVYFYPRANTEGCTTEAGGFRDAWDEYRTRGVVVLGISDDPVTDLRKFRDDHDLPIELLSDEDGEVSAAYDSYGEKQLFGNTFDGVFRNTCVVGPDGTIRLAYEGVDPEGHAAEILGDLDEQD